MATRDEAIRELARREIARRQAEPAQAVAPPAAMQVAQAPVAQAQPIAQQQAPASRLDIISRAQRGELTPQELAGIPAGRESVESTLEIPRMLATGAVAEPLAGIAGLATLPFGSVEAEESIRATQEFLTAQPQTQIARERLLAGAESAPIQAIGKGLQAAEEFTGGIGFEAAGPIGGALGATIPTAVLEAIGLKGISKVRGARKITGLTDDAVEKLQKSGIDVDDLSEQGIAKIQQEVSKQTDEQVRRAKLFEDIDVPTVQSRITREQADFLDERQLRRQVGTKEDVLLKERLGEEAAGFQDAGQRIIDSLGAPGDAGELIKEALDARVSKVAAKTNEAYKKLAELTQGRSIPIIGNKITGKLDNDRISALSGRLDQAERARLNDLFVEFGLDTDPARVDSWVTGRKARAGAIPGKADVTPLSLENIEEFRQALGNMTSPTDSAELRGVAGALKRGVDEELVDMDRAIRSATGPLAQQSKGVLSAARRARALFKGKKELESADGIIGRLTRGKPRTPDEPLILASEITKKLFSDTKDGAIENVSRVVRQLERSGEKGTKALNALQASAVADLMNSATALTKLPGGIPQWLGNQFAKRFDTLNKNGKLERIFKNNPTDLNMLRKLREAGELTVPFSDVAKASGTTDDFLNALTRNPILKRVVQIGGGVGGVVAAEGVERAAKGVSTRKAQAAAKRALSMKPDDAVKIQQVRRLFPNLAAVLAPSQLRQDEQ